MTTPRADAGGHDGRAGPDGQPPTTVDQRGEHQPADPEAAEESQEMADAVKDPDPGA